MPFRITLPAAAAMLAIHALPAQAQSDTVARVDTQSGDYDGVWTGDWQDPHTYRGVWNGIYTAHDGTTVAAEYRGTFIGEGHFVTENGTALSRSEDRRWHEDDLPPPYANDWRSGEAGSYPQPALGYTPKQRRAWLDQCHALYTREELHNGRRERGGLIGGAIGALVGGFAGNRIADGDRLGGTLIGAGLGGVAGAVLGSAVGESQARDLAYTAQPLDDCEAYLIRYEQSFVGPDYRQDNGYGPVMWVRVPIRREQRVVRRQVIIEETVDQADASSAPSAPEIDGKITKIQPVM